MDQNKPEQGKTQHDGVKLSRFHGITGVVFTVLAILLLRSTFMTSWSFKQLQEATDRYIVTQQAAASMQSGSNYLTAQVRSFIATGDPVHAENFFQEELVTRSRDKALDVIDDQLSGTETLHYMNRAMQNSDELIEIEHYAMRLAIEGYGYRLVDYPEPLRQIALRQEDTGLSPAQQREKALSMVFDETYQDYKDRISENVNTCMETLISETRTMQQGSADRLLHVIRQEEILIVIMMLAGLVLVLSTAGLVTHPLRGAVARIQRDEPLSEEGAQELRFLARTYNQVWEQNRRSREQLSYDASHDSLTGLFNRSVFEKLRSRCGERDNAMILIDLDYFKSINDNYGHDIGDRALCRLSALLQESFRAEDYICRIGGDEFAVIMVHVNSSLRPMVEEKIRQLNETLHVPFDGLPPMSLSVGVAFADRENPGDDIYKDADTALYRAKSNGRNTCEFY